MSFKLKNPPVVEAWVQANLKPGAQSEWSWHEAERMLEELDEEHLTEFEVLPRHTPQARKIDKKRKKVEVEILVEPQYMRVRTEDRTRLVQIGQNQLTVTHTRLDSEHFPRFKGLVAEFFSAYTAFCKHIPITGVESAELHYVDIIVIPRLWGSPTELWDLFEGTPSLPSEPFGDTIGANWSITLMPTEKMTANLSIKLNPPDGADGIFRLDWHCLCMDINSPEPKAIEVELDAAHNYLKRCFRAVCKEPVWRTFQEEAL